MPARKTTVRRVAVAVIRFSWLDPAAAVNGPHPVYLNPFAARKLRESPSPMPERYPSKSLAILYLLPSAAGSPPLLTLSVVPRMLGHGFFQVN